MKVHRITDPGGEAFNCASNPAGIDFTLCGLTLDDDPTIHKAIETITGKVTCKHCLVIIHFCKSIKL